MAIESNYDRTVSVQRLVQSDNLESYAAHIEAIFCHIQPFEESYSEDNNGSFGKDWLMFCDSTDILEGDLITTVEGEEYKAVSVEKFDFLGESRHMEVRIRRFMK